MRRVFEILIDRYKLRKENRRLLRETSMLMNRVLELERDIRVLRKVIEDWKNKDMDRNGGGVKELKDAKD